MSAAPAQLLQLSRTLGDPRHDLAILAEGNTSCRAEEEGCFWVKASGARLEGADESSFVLCRSLALTEALDGRPLADEEVREVLAAARLERGSLLRPSVEAFMHAWLLTLPGIEWVGHTHPTPLLSLLCLHSAEDFSRQRLFPDEIVCCGPASCFVPYADPGLALAAAIRDRVLAFVDEWGEAPRTIWLKNHGLIALGANPEQVESATLMAVKATRAWLGALSTGRGITPLSPEDIGRIHTRPDEHYRQAMLWRSQPVSG